MADALNAARVSASMRRLAERVGFEDQAIVEAL
jgi:hypothetical protein